MGQGSSLHIAQAKKKNDNVNPTNETEHNLKIMGDSYGGAKPKTKTPRKNEKPRKQQQKETDQSEIEKPSFTSKQQSSPDDCDSHNVLYFKDDHFDENSCSKRRPNKIEFNKKRGGVVRDTRRNFVKEFLPLTDEAIKNAIKGINDRTDTSTGIKQSSSSSTDLERDSRALSEVTECKKRKKELSPRDKWKRSGFALRKYLASKFGFASKHKGDFQESCLNCVPTEKSTKQKHYKHVCVNPGLSQEEQNQHKDASKNLFIDRNHCDTSNICNKENVVNGHSSHSLLKVLRKSKDKKKCKISPNCDTNERETSTTEEMTSPSSSSQVQETEHSDCSNSLNQLSQEQFMCNSLNQKKQTQTCVRNVPSREIFSRGNNNRSNELVLPLSDISSLSVLPESSSHRLAKTCRRSRPDRDCKTKHVEKKALVGVFDAAIASSSDSENDDAKRNEVIKRPKRRSHSREVKTDQALPLRGFVLSGTPQHRENDSDHSRPPAHQTREESDHNISSGSDVLLGLKYALPYLPERLRNRLHSTTQNHDDAVSNVKKKTGRTINDIQANSICDSDTNNSTIEHDSNKCNVDIDNTAYNISDLQASRHTKDYAEVDSLDIKQGNELTDNTSNRFQLERLSNDDSLNCDLSNDSLWNSNKSEGVTERHELTDDVKFHLNEETGTWTMSGFDEKYKKSIKGGNNLWSPLGYELGQIRRDSYTDWVEQDLLELESSLEDPFNLRGDNLLLNDTSSSSKGDNSFTDCDPFNIRGHNLMLNDTFSSKGNNSFTDCDKDECVFQESSHYTSREKKSDNKHGMHEGLMDLVNGIDEPFVTDDSVNNRRVDKQTNMSETSLPSFWDKWRNQRDLLQGDHSDSQSSDLEDLSTLQSSQDWILRENSISEDLLSKDSCNRHIENFSTKGNHSQDTTKGNRSQDTTKGNHSQDTTQEMRPRLPVMDREAMTPSSTVDDLHSPRSWYTLSQDSSLDADDEFECDCEHCISLRRSHIDPPSYLDLGFMGQPRLESVSENLEPQDDSLASDYAGHNEVDLGLGVHIFESGVGLGLGVMLENVILQLLTDNVIIQMINVQPDLMSDQAPPPAPQSVIDAIPTVSLSQHDIEENPVCPVCLCPCDEGETMSQLPCQHMFHPICVQAWLVKSGTCPVCRYRM